MTKTPLYVFQWISDLGGADTRLKELLILLKNDFDITCIPNDEFRLREKHNTDFLDFHGIKYCMPSSLPRKMEGFAYANCNFRLFDERERVDFIHDTGLKFLWSNDMMWTTANELAGISRGQVDCCLFTSPFHRDAIGPSIFKARPDQKAAILDNYFDSSTWDYVDRPVRDSMVCGKHSRNDIMKFSEDFPVFYESATRHISASYKVMGWSKDLAKKYSWFRFSDKWTLLEPNQETAQKYLSTIDVFLYNCNHRFIENQSRSVIESQLTGCPIVAPGKWNFPNMVWDKRTGFLWDDLEELREIMKDLTNAEFRKKIGRLASEVTRQIWCDTDSARRKWNAVLNYVGGAA